MRRIIVMVLLTITSFALYSQIGFNKNLIWEQAMLFGNTINNDTLLVLVPPLIL